MRYVLAIVAVIVLAANAQAVGLPAGDIVVSALISNGDSGLIEINPFTGDRTILSDNTHGTGVPFTEPSCVQVMSNGDLLVADAGLPDQNVGSPDITGSPPPGVPSRLYIVDPTTGNRTVISQDALDSYPQIGSGPAFTSAGVARQVGNQIVVLAGDGGLGGKLMSVDPTNGNRAVISGGNVGSGEQLLIPGGFLTSGNNAFVGSNQGLFKIDLTTGDRTLVAGPTVGNGVPFAMASDVAAYGGQLYVSGASQSNDLASDGVFRIDPTTGNRSVVTSATVGSGPLSNDLGMPLAIEPHGTILMTVGPSVGNNFNALLTIDPTTGNRAFLSDATHGGGASFIAMHDVTVVPLVGDANGDGVVNSQDLALITSQWMKTGNFLIGDVNGDGVVNSQDVALVSSNWLQTSLGNGVTVTNTVAPVPEPASLLLAALGSISLLAMRRKR